MIGQDWHPADEGNPEKRADARHQLHSVLQWMARLANSYLEAEPSGRHLELTWDPARHAFLTRRFNGDLAVELRLPKLEMQFLEDGRLSPHVLNIEGRSPAEIEAWILVELLHRGIDRSRFTKRLPYAAQTLMSGDARQFSPEDFEAELDGLAVWLDNATTVLTRLAAKLPSASHGIRCWPEQLHLAIEIPLEPGSASEALRAGLSLGDEKYAEPHFFVIAEKGRSGSTMLPNAVLTASRIAASSMSPEDVVGFLEKQIEASRKKLAH